MFFDLPNHNTLYQALLERDERYDGRVYVCVSSTGVFCRLTCPARKPNPENCTFYATVGECLQAGFRACKRCHPMQREATPAIGELLAELERRPNMRWSEAHISKMGYDLSTVRRSFKRQFGMTFLEIARLRRLREGFTRLSEGEKVITAQQDASFESASAFREAFTRLLGASPKALLGKKHSGPKMLLADWIPTPLGDMIAVSSKSHLHLLEFVDRKALPTELKKLREFARGDLGVGTFAPTDQIKSELEAFFTGQLDSFKTPLVLHGTPFLCQVWEELQRIPAGVTCSYSELARRIGRPSASRAVARANGANQLALIIPCHRVIGTDGSLTGYGGGLWRKQRLLDIERRYKVIKNNDTKHNPS